MNIEIFYFSGTGNSLFLAKEMTKHLPKTKLTPIVSAINLSVCTTNADAIGFIFPVHALTIPIIVKRFLKKLNIESTEYIFAVATRGGTSFHGFKVMEQILRKKKQELDARFIVDMILNDSRSIHFSIPEKEILNERKENEKREAEVIAQYVTMKKKVNEHDRSVTIKSANSKLGTIIIEGIVLLGMNIAEKTRGVDYFFHDDNCNSCGICEKVCLSGKIGRLNGRPEWKEEVFCYMCYACINYCPLKSIQIRDIPGVKSYTLRNGRYHHPEVKAGDIEAQKNLTSSST